MYKAKTELKGQIDNSKIIVGDFNISLLVMNGTTKQRTKECNSRLEH